VSVDEVADIALRFCVTHPAVSCAIPGMRSLTNVERNVASADAGPLTAEQIELLRTHRWVRSFYS
jgi:aryl-alcohol dehydrogenase-like predicted oxidoreductase